MTEQGKSRSKTAILIASSFASFLSTIITNPIEVAKLNRQYLITLCPQYPHNSYKEFHLCDCSKFKFSNSFNGLKVAIPQVLFSNIIYMQLYEYQRNKYLKLTKNSETATLMSSIISRVIVSTLMLPLQVLRVRMGNQQSIKQIAFNKGLKITLTRDIIFSGLFWTSLQTCRNYFNGGFQYRQNARQQKNNINILGINFLSGLTVSMVVSVITTPLDTVKTRIQSQSETKNKYSILRQMCNIYRKEGLKGLFSGVEYRVIKNSIHSCIYLMLYEWAINKTPDGLFQ